MGSMPNLLEAGFPSSSSLHNNGSTGLAATDSLGCMPRVSSLDLLARLVSQQFSAPSAPSATVDHRASSNGAKPSSTASNQGGQQGQGSAPAPAPAAPQLSHQPHHAVHGKGRALWHHACVRAVHAGRCRNAPRTWVFEPPPTRTDVRLPMPVCCAQCPCPCPWGCRAP